MEKRVKHSALSKTQAKRRLIMDSAIQVISNFGFRKTTMDDIAYKAGIAKGTIYLYFNDKMDIFRSIIEEKLGGLISDVFKGAKTAPDAPAKLLKAIRILIEYHQSDTLFNQLLTENAEMLGPVVLGIVRKYEQTALSFIEGILKEGVAEGSIEPNLDIEMTAKILLRVNQATILRIKTGDRIDVERYLTALEYLVKNGVRKRSSV